ncbi:hypothetical protein K8I85_15000, partial [bacterium]|nr:hypothetical protein [bacterium]
GDVRVDVFDAGGRRVRTLADGPRSAGRQQVVWDGRSAGGVAVGTGVYFVRLQAAGRLETAKVLRVR